MHTDASLDGLGEELYKEQNGIERVIAYASRGLRNSEKHYPAHKLEFLCLKWAVTKNFMIICMAIPSLFARIIIPSIRSNICIGGSLHWVPTIFS